MIIPDYNVEGAYRRRGERVRVFLGPLRITWWIRHLEDIFPFLGLGLLIFMVFPPVFAVLTYFFGGAAGIFVIIVYFGLMIAALGADYVAFPFMVYGKDVYMFNAREDEAKWVSLIMVSVGKPQLLTTHEEEYELREWPTNIKELLPANTALTESSKKALPTYFWRPWSKMKGCWAINEFWVIKELDNIKTEKDTKTLREQMISQHENGHENGGNTPLFLDVEQFRLKPSITDGDKIKELFDESKDGDNSEEGNEKVELPIIVFESELVQLPEDEIEFLSIQKRSDTALRVWNMRIHSEFNYMRFKFDSVQKKDGSWIDELYFKVAKQTRTVEDLLFSRPTAMIEVKGVHGTAPNLLWGVVRIDRWIRGIPVVTSMCTRETEGDYRPPIASEEDVEKIEQHLGRYYRGLWIESENIRREELKHMKEVQKEGISYEGRKGRRRTYYGFEQIKIEYRYSFVAIFLVFLLTTILTKFGFFDFIPFGPAVGS